MITIYAVPAATRAFPKGLKLVDEYGAPVPGAEGATFFGRSAAEGWAGENGYYISKTPYAPADVAAEA